MVQFTSFFLLGVASLSALIAAHPGEGHNAEAAARAAFLQSKSLQSRSIANCLSSSLKARGYEARNIARREAALQKIREARGLRRYMKARDLDTLLNRTHHSNLTGLTPFTDPDMLFHSNGTCVLSEDVTQGPYYVTGELIRNDLTESQKGVPLYLDIQLVDSSTCDPIPEVYLDIWHCNATGVYSGIVANGNGNADDSSNLNTTFLRGVQKTGPDGVVQFQTIFPGHYTSRANHIHVLSHPANETIVYPNGTISGLYSAHASHVGQLFFDQDLISAVEDTDPYSTNTQTLTENSEDSILAQEADSGIDPFVEYVFLGDDVSDGIFGWISVVIDTSEDSTITPAAEYTAEGGESNDNSRPF
ncbi:extracellular dioxygenase, putative [Talaromyces stipitatus ATCC 10500]|uniref:Extracellular dioxygenase, putative n=1 Tax=Talaromyces stipitatus (strain ATCC 10500 / CBS 375.48 / QM 6759 / NRRL 1006) TaxID=441959 RepID=B8MTU1_TALSN|nr:extracellular dioxygenase, putative [Talaromyces stipitatus ATCC 10500]EED12484.1 extracellular dioxygenase, putative [Talaromyces stipitatus ATCC 10500]